MEDEGVIPKSQEILKSSNVYEDLGYISEEEISETFTWLVPKIMAKHNMNEIIAVAAEYRCFEDFDYRKSRQKIDFYRKWYHTRAKISVESIRRDYLSLIVPSHLVCRHIPLPVEETYPLLAYRLLQDNYAAFRLSAGSYTQY